ncbi:IS66 family insertion sequence element accessory protein TnpB [Acidithiobacillus sulfuriphilus]
MWLNPRSRIWLAASFCGHAFVFRNRRGDRLKLLLRDGLGFWLLYRPLDRGRLHWPRADTGDIELSTAQWAMLVEGRPWTPLPALEKCTPTML